MVRQELPVNNGCLVCLIQGQQEHHNEDEAPSDERVVEVLRRVRLGHLLYRYNPGTASSNGNGSVGSVDSEAGSSSDAGKRYLLCG
jgi:hypothetical protein